MRFGRRNRAPTDEAPKDEIRPTHPVGSPVVSFVAVGEVLEDERSKLESDFRAHEDAVPDHLTPVDQQRAYDTEAVEYRAKAQAIGRVSKAMEELYQKAAEQK